MGGLNNPNLGITDDQAAALAGTSGTAPSGTNKLVDNADTRNTNARTPSAHATTHVTGSTDVIASAVAAGAAGLMSGADKTKIDGVAAGATVGADWDTNVANKPTLGTAAAKDIPAAGDASATEVVYGSDTRLTNARTPSTHASTHINGSTDVIAVASDANNVLGMMVLGYF